MKILKMKNFFIIVVSVSLVFSSCKEEKEQTEISSSSTIVQEEKSQKNKTENVTDSDKGGIENMVHEIFYAPSLDYGRNVKRGTVNYPSVRDIDLKNENGANRFASDIMKIIRQRTSGLHFVYDKYLKKNPGFHGKITLKFTIAPEGKITDVSIVSSTTQNSKFDAEIQQLVGSWGFRRVKSGNTTVIIPFTFFE